jgi:hypothetical protein
MKSLLKSIRLINAGFVLGAVFMLWLMDDDKEKEKIEPYTPSDEFNNIYNHYNNKEKTNA